MYNTHWPGAKGPIPLGSMTTEHIQRCLSSLYAKKHVSLRVYALLPQRLPLSAMPKSSSFIDDFEEELEKRR